MSAPSQFRPLNPRLGTHYAIFTSAFAALVLFLAMLEQLGASRLWLSHVMILTPVLFYLGVAVLTRTLDLHEFYAAGRRVPHVFGGLALAATAIGGVGFFAFTGSLYLIGFDALALSLGWGGGLLAAAVLFVPYLRKSGAYTLPGFFRIRFANPVLPPVAALLILAPALLLLAAELRLGAFVASLFVSVSFELAVALGAGVIAILTLLGGIRSLTWTQCVQYMVIVGGFLLPLVILSATTTNLPLPQLTYAGLFERLASQEVVIGATQTAPVPLAEALPGERPEPATRPFLHAFAAFSRADFTMLLVCFLAGTAAMPALLLRAGPAPNTFEARRTMAWGLLFLALFLVSAPAYAVFAKFLTLQDVVGTPPSQLPDWIAGLREAGLADFGDKNKDGVISAAELLISRDGVTLALPIMGGFPFVLVVMLAACGLTAALAAAAAQLFVVGAVIGEDLFHRLLFPNTTPGRRMFAARLAIAFTAGLTAWFVATLNFDALRAAVWALSMAAAAFLPALVLSIWWKRTTAWGVLAAMLAGFLAAAAHIVHGTVNGAPPFGLSTLLAAIPAMPVGFLAGIGVSLITPAPSAAVGRTVEELRDAGGEALLDKAARLAALRAS